MVFIIGRFICFVFSKLFLSLKVFGRDRVPRDGALIIASNHVSFLDPVIVGVSAPRPVYFIARDDLFTVKFFGALIKRLNTFPVKREGSSISTFKEAFKRLKKEQALVIFPEGTRSIDGSIEKEKARSGVGFIAAKSKCKVVPVYVDGTKEALPKKARFIKPRPVRVYFGDPLDPAVELNGNSHDNYERFTNLIMESIQVLKMKAQGVNIT